MSLVAGRVYSLFYKCVLLIPLGEREVDRGSPQSPVDEWYKGLLSESDAKIMEHSGKMVLLFEILKMAEALNDKVYVFFVFLP